MTRTNQRKILFSIAATMLAMVLGIVCGYLLGCALTLRQTTAQLENATTRIQDRAASFMAETFQLLNQLPESSAQACSDAELLDFHGRVFRSEFVRDIGRVRAGKIICSVALGRLQAPFPLPRPEFSESYQGRLYQHYRSIPPQQDAPENNAIQMGDFYVVLSNYRYSYLVMPPVNMTRRVGTLNQRRVEQKMGTILDLNRYPLDRDSTLWQNGNLFVTRCESRLSRPSCVTTFESVHDALREARQQLLICSVAGGLVGLIFGLSWALIFRRHLGMERQLLRAIRNHEIQLVYQPIVDLANGRIVEVEALARWTDEDGFAVSPAVFIPIAEQGGYVGELTRLVVRKALHDFHPLLAQEPDFRINVNITAYDLADANFMPMLEQALTRVALQPRSLALEITESSTAKSPRVRQTIHELRQRGHSVQIDDFGTGYSSLSYLHDLSIDAIKIDRAFTQSIGTEAVTVGILPQILSMAQALNLQVIAEGIETAEQAAYFAGAGVGLLGQGWLFGRPIPAQALLQRIADSRRAAVTAENKPAS